MFRKGIWHVVCIHVYNQICKQNSLRLHSCSLDLDLSIEYCDLSFLYYTFGFISKMLVYFKAKVIYFKQNVMNTIISFKIYIDLDLTRLHVESTSLHLFVS